MPERRTVFAAARVSPAERADWLAKAEATGVPLSDLLRQAMARTRTWTAPAVAVERERTRQVARIGNNLNQIARWTNTYAERAEAVERVKDLYDRVRTAVDESLAGVVRAVRAGADAARRADRDLAGAGRALRQAGDALDRGLQDARREVARALELIRQPDRGRGPERDHGPSH